MLFLLSPAKSLDYDTPLADLPHTRPLFTDRSAQLIERLRSLSAPQVAGLMELSDKLAELNVQRYAAWSPRFTRHNSRQAVLAFDGDVYDGLRARQLSADDLGWAQEHVCILSGLYGVLRPMDWMQPYRLEMGTSLAVGDAPNLYRFWDPVIASYLNRRSAADRTPVVVNLASQEYFRAVNTRVLKPRVVTCVFQEWHGGTWKVISFSAKRARGLMARFAITHRIATPAGLGNFNLDGYSLSRSASDTDRLVFRRKVAP